MDAQIDKSVYTFGFIKGYIFGYLLRRILKRVGYTKKPFPNDVGCDAPNVSLYDHKLNKNIKLYDIMPTPPRPLVITFGSYTWPPWSDVTDVFFEVVEKYKDRCDFIAIYIVEAHAEDEWKIEGHGLCYRQPKTLEERVKIARDFIKNKNFKLPLYVDLMDNNANVAYDARPERLYIICGGKIVMKGGEGPFGYKISEVDSFLAKNL